METNGNRWNTLEATVSYKAWVRLTPTLTHVVTYALVTSGAEDDAMSRGDVDNVFIDCLGPDNNVIQVNMADASYEWAESGSDSPLVNRWCIFDSHWHYDPFVKAPRCVYRCKFYVIRVHASLKKTVCHVEGSEEFSSSAV